ncbi:hypothetical protein ACOMHN_046839 [Nucella lapillus]
MFLVGLTGGIATGKSTAADMFRMLGTPVIDADKIARDVVEPGRPAWKKIREQFGEDMCLEDGQLDRAKLGSLVFSDASKRRQLNSITHPEIRSAMFWKIFLCFIKGYQFVVLDIPLLFESRNMISFVSYIVVVSCTEGQQLQRLMSRNQFSRAEAERRIDAQMPLMEKRRLASCVIDNSGTQEMVGKQVLDLHKKFRRSRAHWPMRILGLAQIGSVEYPDSPGDLTTETTSAGNATTLPQEQCHPLITLTENKQHEPQPITDMTTRTSLVMTCQSCRPIWVALAARDTMDTNYIVVAMKYARTVIMQNCKDYSDNEPCDNVMDISRRVYDPAETSSPPFIHSVFC